MIAEKECDIIYQHKRERNRACSGYKEKGVQDRGNKL